MRHNNISIFIPNIGCPNMCSFCNQHTISGAKKAPTEDEVKNVCRQAWNDIKDRKHTEIAFFGGSFTAIPYDYMISLLECVQEFLGDDGFYGIRISTRPDCISSDILEQLKKYGVTSIELGAQSMKNDVLISNDRGHTVEDVKNASRLIKQFGFELGLQMMIGLYKSSINDERKTMERIIKIHPDTVRIYPVVVLKGTKLAELYKAGEYKPMPFDDVVKLCGNMLVEFDIKEIDVIKCGLHASDGVEGDMVAGYYHPAFKELCEAEIYKNGMEYIISDRQQLGDVQTIGSLFAKKEIYTFAVNPSCISKAIGHKKSNYEYFKKQGIIINVVGDSEIPRYQCELRR